MQQSTALQFNALSGPELLVVVLDEIKKKLEATGEFDAHVSFPWVKWNFHVGLVVYPKQAMESEPGIVVTGTAAHTTEPPAQKPVEIKVDGVQVIDTPDVARLASGQPLPTPSIGAGGVMVDSLIVPAPPEAKGAFGYRGGKHGKQ